ncbi:hypothetical protein EDD18DRAFT_1109343 [Armillaria luteobubalina]|uniref:Uncharacterized protein n=1 Tax=Armillaria luteobubalina TaxID=153913 RepID=A0AA39PXR0_9AGAR|nr:hypothetical protein EDD18DRAFT_1109343 [Armillaria luteobubalina]
MTSEDVIASLLFAMKFIHMSVASTASIVDRCESPTTMFHRRCRCLACQVKSVDERSTQQLAVKLLGGVDVRTDQHRCTCAGSKHEVASEEPVSCRTRSPSFEPYPLSSRRRTHKGALSGTTFGSRCHIIDRSSSFGSSGSFGTLDRALLSAVYCDDSQQRSLPPAGNERHGASSSLYAEPSDSSLHPPRSYPWLRASDTDNMRRHLYYRPKPLQRYVHIGDESLPWMFHDSSTSPLAAVPPAIASDEDMSAGNQRRNGCYSGPPVSVSDVVEGSCRTARLHDSFINRDRRLPPLIFNCEVYPLPTHVSHDDVFLTLSPHQLPTTPGSGSTSLVPNFHGFSDHCRHWRSSAICRPCDAPQEREDHDVKAASGVQPTLDNDGLSDQPLSNGSHSDNIFHLPDDTHAASIKPSSGSFEDLPTNGALIDLNRRSSKPRTSGMTVTSIVIDASLGDSAHHRMRFAGIHEESGSMSYSIAEVLPVSTPSRSQVSGMSYSYPSSGCEEVDQLSGDKSKLGPVDMGYCRVQFMPWNTTSRTYKMLIFDFENDESPLARLILSGNMHAMLAFANPNQYRLCRNRLGTP